MDSIFCAEDYWTTFFPIFFAFSFQGKINIFKYPPKIFTWFCIYLCRFMVKTIIWFSFYSFILSWLILFKQKHWPKAFCSCKWEMKYERDAFFAFRSFDQISLHRNSYFRFHCISVKAFFFFLCYVVKPKSLS